MPSAAIVGVDINAWCLRQCRAKNNDEKLRFVHRNLPEFESLH
jgi:hypothetical protein